jgi:CRP-like cAMP-binding protein
LPVQPIDRLIRKLESITSLSEDERQAIRNLPLTLREFRADQDIVREGDRPWQCCLVLEGFLYRYKVLPDGTRQILSFHVPGDIPDLQSLHLSVMDHALAPVAAAKVALIPHDALRDLCHSQPRVADIFWRDTLIDAAIFREWIVNVGGREAYGRIAHVICEVFLKLKAVGLTDGNSFEFPVTQSKMGDATGLSTVHVNRSLMALRADGMITLERGRCTIDNWEGLKQAAMFDPTYLHLQGPSVAA